MRLKGHIAVITGAGAGIGRSTALEFVKAGATVVVADVNTEGAAETVRQVAATGGRAVAAEADVSSPASVEQLATRTLALYGRVNVLVNNAAVQVNKTIEETTFEEWNREFAVNVGGVFLCSK